MEVGDEWRKGESDERGRVERAQLDDREGSTSVSQPVQRALQREECWLAISKVGERIHKLRNVRRSDVVLTARISMDLRALDREFDRHTSSQKLPNLMWLESTEVRTPWGTSVLDICCTRAPKWVMRCVSIGNSKRVHGEQQ